jgi:DNA-binding transcriptional ArsR family regulator
MDNLDYIFSSLADPTRRDILRRIIAQELSVSEIAQPYDLSLAAVSKHLSVLERARLVFKRRAGKQQMVVAVPDGLESASRYLREFEAMWQERFEALERYLKEE